MQERRRGGRCRVLWMDAFCKVGIVGEIWLGRLRGGDVGSQRVDWADMGDGGLQNGIDMGGYIYRFETGGLSPIPSVLSRSQVSRHFS